MSRKLAQQLRRVPQHLREGGLRHTVELACAYRRIPAWLYYRDRTQLLRLNSVERIRSFRVRTEYDYLRADASHIDELSHLDPREEPAFIERLFRSFIERRAACYAIRRQGRIVAYNWLFHDHYIVTTDGYDQRQLGIALQSNDSFFGNGFIAPDYRMKGLFPLLILMAVRDRPPQTAFFTTIERLNTNSLRAHERIGFEPQGALVCQRVLASPYFWSWETHSGTRLLGTGKPEVALYKLLPAVRVAA